MSQHSSFRCALTPLVVALLSVPVTACAEEAPVKAEALKIAVLPEDKNAYSVAKRLRDRAKIEVERRGPPAMVGGDELTPRTAPDMVSSIAVNPDGAVFYLIPHWEYGRNPGPTVDVCRFEVDLSALPPGFSAEVIGQFYALVNIPDCTVKAGGSIEAMPGRRNETDPTGYRTYSSASPGGGRSAALIVPIDESKRPLAAAALRAYLGPSDPLRIALPFPPSDRIAGYARSESGRVLFYRMEPFSEDAVCIAEGMDWNAGVTWLANRGEEELERYCSAAMAQRDDEEAARARAEWERNPPRIEIVEPPPIQTGNRPRTPSASR